MDASNAMLSVEGGLAALFFVACAAPGRRPPAFAHGNPRIDRCARAAS